MRYWFLVFLIIITINIPVNAEELPLTKALDIAAKNNPDLRSARAAWEASKSKIPQALSLSDPKIGVEYDSIPANSSNFSDGMKMYTADQMIMFPGKIFAEWMMAQNESKMFEARYQKKLREVVSDIKSAYYDLFVFDHSIQIISQNKDLLQSFKKIAESKYSVGQVTQADALMAASEYAMAVNELENMRNERNVKAARLNSLLFKPVDAKLGNILQISLSSIEGLPKLSEIERRALNNRPELMEMKAMLDIKDAEQLKSKMGFFPDTTLGYKKRSGDGYDVMFSFTIPLYFWKQGYQLSETGSNRESADSAYKNMANMTSFEVRESYVMAENAQRTMKLYENKLVPLAEQALKVGVLSYQANKIDFSTLLNIQKNYRATKVKYYESRANYGKALAMFEKIIGRNINDN
ncbi:TolC family protein [Candidatus Saganbacteria bacterium]|nr:TolC family protein [Candidatus Saganbacteria bacterium]